MSRPAAGSDRVATLLVAVDLEATQFTTPVVVEGRAWGAVDLAELVAAADVPEAAAVVAEAVGDRHNAERQKNDGVQIKDSMFAENHGD